MALDPSRIFASPIANHEVAYTERDATPYALCCGADRAAADGDFCFVDSEGF